MGRDLGEVNGASLGFDLQVTHAQDDSITQDQQLQEILQSGSATLPPAFLVEPVTRTGLPRDNGEQKKQWLELPFIGIGISNHVKPLVEGRALTAAVFTSVTMELALLVRAFQTQSSRLSAFLIWKKLERSLVDDDETALADIIATQEFSFHRDPGAALERRHQGATRETAF